MADALLALERQIRKLRALGGTPKAVAPLLAEELRPIVDRQISAGLDPYGSAWQLTKEGGRALKNAGQYLTLGAVGAAVVATIVGPPAMHHLGKAAGRITRRIIPVRKLPSSWAKAAKAAGVKHFRQTVSPRG
jgi:hypothetical protein